MLIIRNAALQEKVINGRLVQVLRGVVAGASLENIQAANYQREILPGSKIPKLMEAQLSSILPDVYLGVRSPFRHRVNSRGEVCLNAPAFVIDGRQRNAAAKAHWENNVDVGLGCMIVFNTTYEQERDLFYKLNKGGTRVHSNIIVRNLANESPTVRMLLGLNDDNHFVLRNRICWKQNMSHTDLINGIALAKLTLHLHVRNSSSSSRSNAYDTVQQLNAIRSTAGGVANMRRNISYFFQVMDDVFSISELASAKDQIRMQGQFLHALVDFFTHFRNFWIGREMFVSADNRRRLARLDLTHDPEIVRMCSYRAFGEMRQYLKALCDHGRPVSARLQPYPESEVE